MKIIKQELQFEECLKQRLEFICEFAKVTPTFINSSIGKDVKHITKTVRSVNDLNMVIKDFEHSSFEIEKENRSLKYQLELKDNEISNLKNELSTKDKIINKLQAEKKKIKQELKKI